MRPLIIICFLGCLPFFLGKGQNYRCNLIQNIDNKSTLEFPFLTILSWLNSYRCYEHTRI